MLEKQDPHEWEPLHPENRRARSGVKQYLLQVLLISSTLIPYFLLWKLWISKPLPEILGEINGFAPPCKNCSLISVLLRW